MKKIIITGNNSYIGTSVEAYLNQWTEKYLVTTINVRGGHWKNVSFEGYDTLYHVAGIAHSDVRGVLAEDKKSYYSVNTDLTLDVAKKAKKDGVRQFIFMSSIIVYGDSAPIGEDKVIRANTPLDPANFYGDSKKKAEEGLKALRDENFKIVILRPPMIYGRGSKGNYSVLRKIAQLTPIFPKIHNHRSMLYLTNLCEFVRLMIENEEDGVFLPQNREYMNTSKMVRSIAAVHGKRVVLVPGIELLLKAASLITPMANKAFGNLVIDKNLSQYKDDYQIVSAMDSIRETESG